MDTGYVYVLINQSMPGLIKIGKTRRDSRERARELFNTGVPTPFQVAFEIFSNEIEVLENKIHTELEDFRVANNREFFKYPLYKAIAILIKLNSSANSEDEYYAEDILNKLKEKYKDWIKEDIISVRIIQNAKRVWIEITTENEINDLLNQKIERSDLAFISGGVEEDSLYFSPKNTVSINANKFIKEFDPYSIGMTTALFNERSLRIIEDKYTQDKKEEL
jgi:hypothetical protein